MRVYEALAAACAEQGVEVAFGLVGDGNVKFVDCWARVLGRSYVAARHEAAAVAMATGYSRATDRVGFATVTQGPGFTNGLTALTAGVKGRIPAVLLTGLPPTTLPGHPQAIDQEALLRTCGAGHQPVSPGTLARDVATAFTRARHERRPIAMCVPTDVQDADAPASAGALTPGGAARADGPDPPDDAALATVADLVEAAARPLVVAGRGVLGSPGARAALLRLADRAGALLATTLPIRGYFAGHPFDLGVLGGFASDLTIAEVERADLVLAFGTSLNYRSTKTGKLLHPDAVVVQCDVQPDPPGASITVDHRLVGDAGAVAGALAALLAHRRAPAAVTARTPELAQRLADGRVHDAFEDRSPDGCLDPRTLVQALDGLLPDARTVTVDGGHCSGFPSIYLRVPDHHGYQFSLEFASIGLGLGTALGAAVGRPDRLSVLVVGDGALMMSLPDLETAVRERIPLLVVVLNDQAYGSELAILEASDLPPDVGRFDNPSFAAVARSMGAVGVDVRAPGDLEQLRRHLDSPAGPVVADCAIDPSVRGPWLRGAFDRQLSLR